MALSTNRMVTFATIAISSIVLAVNFCILVKLDGLDGRIDSPNFLEGRLAALERRVDELPARIGRDIRDINRDLLLTISASQQKPAQIIVIRWPEAATVQPVP